MRSSNKKHITIFSNFWRPSNSENLPRNSFTILRLSFSLCFLSFFWVLAIVSAPRAKTNDKTIYVSVFASSEPQKPSSNSTCFDVDFWLLWCWFVVVVILMVLRFQIWEDTFLKKAAFENRFQTKELRFEFAFCRFAKWCSHVWEHLSYFLSFIFDGNLSMLKQQKQWDDHFPWFVSNIAEFSLFIQRFAWHLAWQSLCCFFVCTCFAGRSYHPTLLKVMGFPLHASKRSQHIRADCHWNKVEKG